MSPNLYEIASDCFQIPQNTLNENSSRSNTPQWDSLNHLKFFMAIEEAYEVQFSPEDIVGFTSLKQIQTRLNALIS